MDRLWSAVTHLRSAAEGGEQMIFHKKLYFFLFILFSIIVLHKNILNEEADVTGSFKASLDAYLVAASTIVFTGLIILTNLRRRFYFYAPLTISLAFYSMALTLSPVSALPLVSSFRSISGIGYVIAASSFASALEKKSIDFISRAIYLIMATAAGAFIFGTIIFNEKFAHADSATVIRAGSGALFFLYLALWHIISYLHRKKISDLFIAILICFSAIFLNSFSAYLSLFMSLAGIMWMSGRRIISVLLFFGAAVLIFAFYSYIISNIDADIFNKPARAFLIGSGRFPMYEVALVTYLELPWLNKIFGVGFMAEREILVGSQLAWITDVHNSLISNLLGLGLVGLIISIIYTLSPFFIYSKICKRLGSEVALKWIGMHILFFSYGMTSTSYFSQPSFQLLFFLIFTTFLARRASSKI